MCGRVSFANLDAEHDVAHVALGLLHGGDADPGHDPLVHVLVQALQGKKSANQKRAPSLWPCLALLIADINRLGSKLYKVHFEKQTVREYFEKLKKTSLTFPETFNNETCHMVLKGDKQKLNLNETSYN